MTPLTEQLLLTLAHRQIRAPDADAGLSLLAEAAGGDASPGLWQSAVAEAVAEQLIHDPVRLPAGALQCHWHLQLTPSGTAAAQRLSAETRP
nr:hypothetical protein [uncultured Rhodopila sp.]